MNKILKMRNRIRLENENRAKFIVTLIFLALCMSSIVSCSTHNNSPGEIQQQQNSDDVVVRLSRYEVNPEYQAPFHKVVSDYVSYSLGQDGNIMSEAYYEDADPSIIWIIERWNDKYAIEKSSIDSLSLSLASMTKPALITPAKHIYVKDLEPLPRQEWRKPAGESDTIITIMLFVDAKKGTEKRFKEVYHEAMPQFRSEPGVINYQLSQLEEDSTRFVTYEKFRNEEAFQYHLKFPPIKPVIDYLNSSIRNPPFQSGLHRLIPFTSLSFE